MNTQKQHHRPVVISLHGILSRGEWQKKLSPLLHNCKYYPLDYGYWIILELFFPFLRTRRYEWFRKEYNNIREKNDRAIPSIIAHSFGTLILANAIKIFTDLKFDKIILTGSIIPRDFNFEEHYNRNRYTRLLNIISRNDIWSNLATFLPQTDSSGANGFINENCIEQDDDYKYLGHSGMLEDDVFIAKIVPFLSSPSIYQNGKTLFTPDVYSAAAWSAMTYYEQYVGRFISAKANGKFYSENGEENIEKLNIIIPKEIEQTKPDRRTLYFKEKYKASTFSISNNETRSAYYKNGEYYDIPSIIATAELLHHNDRNLFIGYFKEILENLIKTNPHIAIINY